MAAGRAQGQSRRRQGLDQPAVHSCHRVEAERAGRLPSREEPLGPKDLDAASGEGSTDQRPVSSTKQSPHVDGNLVAHDAAHYADVLALPVNNLGAVAGTDQKLPHSRTNEPPSTRRRGRPLYFLASTT